jgi:hypothetical protein
MVNNVPPQGGGCDEARSLLPVSRATIDEVFTHVNHQRRMQR